jgi:hypothetical protein
LDVPHVGVNRAVDGTDFDAGGEPFGLLRNDGSTRPAFTAYQVASRYFAGVRDATYSNDPASGVTKVTMQRTGERVTVLWTMSPGGATASIDAMGSQALKVNKWGEATTISASGGKLSVGLAGATANSNGGDRSDYVVGGDPVILVERSDGNTQAAFRSLDDNPIPGAVADSASSSSSSGSQQKQPALAPAKDSEEKKRPTAVPTPAPKKATPTPTPKKK